jgi:hypothetical protein
MNHTIITPAPKCSSNSCGANGVCDPRIGCACYPFYSGSDCSVYKLPFSLRIEGDTNMVANRTTVNPLRLLAVYESATFSRSSPVRIESAFFIPSLPDGFGFDATTQIISGTSDASVSYQGLVFATVSSDGVSGQASTSVSFTLTIDACARVSCGSNGVCR